MLQNIAEYMAGYSDLELDSLKIRVKEGKKVKLRIRAKIHNHEPSYSCASSLTLYLSRNRSIDLESDIKLMNIEIPQIAAGKNKIVRSTLILPTDIKGGNWHVIGRINEDGEAREFDLENNTATAKATLPRR
jgi:hypothetical protein